LVSRALSNKALVVVGTYSYSIYLWHWPFITFGTHLFPQVNGIRIISGLISIIPSYFSYKYCEQKFRFNESLGEGRYFKSIYFFVISPITLAIALFYFSSVILGPNFIKEYGSQSNLASTVAYKTAPCSPEYFQKIAPAISGQIQCQQSKAGERPQIALLGDSHAQMLFTSLAKLLPERNVGYYIQYDSILRYTKKDSDFRKTVNAVANNPTIEIVILNFWYDQKGAPKKELNAIFTTLSKSGKKIFILDDAPSYPFHSNSCLYPKGIVIKSKNCTQAYSIFKERFEVYAKNLSEISSDFPAVSYLQSAKHFCTNDLCDMRQKGKLLYSDAAHLNEEGATFLLQNVVENNLSFKEAISD
jgi:hypothetical protein